MSARLELHGENSDTFGVSPLKKAVGPSFFNISLITVMPRTLFSKLAF